MCKARKVSQDSKFFKPSKLSQVSKESKIIPVETIAVSVEGEDINFRRTVETEPTAYTNRGGLSQRRDDEIDN